MMEKIGILGSTGSIGKQALDILHDNKQYQVEYLSCFSDIDELIKHREEMEKIHAEADLAKRKFNHKMQKRIDADDDKGLSGLMGGGFDA